MSASADPTLTKAYELIESERLSEAASILKPYLDTNPDNADAWWLYSHAVTDAEEARKALNNVLRLDGNYPGAAELSKSLPGVPSAPTGGIKRLGAPPPPMPESLPSDSIDDDVSDLFEDEVFDDEFDEEIDDLEIPPATTRSSRRKMLIPLVAGLVILLLVVAVLIINPFKSRTPTPTATTGAQVALATDTALPVIVPTESHEPTETSVIETDEVIPSNAPTETTEAEDTPQETPLAAESPAATETISESPDFTAIVDTLDGFAVPDDGIEVMQTSLGETLVVTVCEDRSRLSEALNTIALQSNSFADSVEGVAVRIGDCNAPSTQRIIGVGIADAVNYSGGTMTSQQFQRLWRPLG